MTDSCATCLYFRSSTCRYAPPQAMQGGFPGWPPVASTDWCGLGADSSTKASFSTGVTGLPAAPEISNSISSTGWTVSVDDPSGGHDGDFWLKVDGTSFSLQQRVAGVWTEMATWTSA